MIKLLNDTNFILKLSDGNRVENVVITSEMPDNTISKDFIDAMGNHRIWNREKHIAK